MKTKAKIYTIITFAIALFLVVIIIENPIIRFKKKNAKKIGAIAIRDDESAFFKWGSKLFTVPYINKYYSGSMYFTQYQHDDKKAEIVTSLKKLLETNEYVDIYLLAHSNYYYMYVEEIEPELRSKIRLVYNTGCGNATQYEYWLNLGAKSYVSHKNKGSLSPFFYFCFLRRWSKGYTLANATNVSNRIAIKKIRNLSKINTGIKNNFDNLNPEAILYGDKNIKINPK